MRILLRVFVFLDLFSLFFIAVQLWSFVQSFSQITALSDKVSGLLMLPMFILIGLGAYQLFFFKKFGFISYYIQFPFRLYLWIFSIGFITFFLEFVENYDDKWFPILLKMCFVAEFIRLYFTIRGHINRKML